MKVCPVCKSRCFDDMDTCYGCLHQFNESQKRGEKMKTNLPNHQEASYMPEYFEIEDNVEKYLMLEDVQDFLKRKNFERPVKKLPDVKINKTNQKIIIEISVK